LRIAQSILPHLESPGELRPAFAFPLELSMQILVSNLPLQGPWLLSAAAILRVPERPVSIRATDPDERRNADVH
jgi:hypothetical protein